MLLVKKSSLIQTQILGMFSYYPNSGKNWIPKEDDIIKNNFNRNHYSIFSAVLRKVKFWWKPASL